MASKNQNNKQVLTQLEIYEGGCFQGITIDDLKDNPTAIRQLINDHNEKASRIGELDKELQEIKGELEYQNTYPFITTFAAVFNVVGTILVGVSVNQITSAPQCENTTSSFVLLVLGGVIVLAASISTILYKWGRKWCNKNINNPR